MIGFLLQRPDYFYVWSDFSLQQVPFGMALHNALTGLNPGGWTWSHELGMSTIQAYSFYVMGSPFFYLTMPFPVDWYPFLVGWLYIIKYTVASVTAYYYIRHFTSRDISAMCGAVFYAFSGFQATNLMFFHFHDVVAFFPLLLLGIEKVLADPKDRKLMIFAVFINSLVNYYFFVMETIFIVIYFLFRALQPSEVRPVKRFFSRLLSCLLSGVWGAAMSAILLLPSVLYVLNTARAENMVYLNELSGKSNWVLFVIKGLLMPGDTMYLHAGVIQKRYSSTSAWLPMVGMALTMAFLMKEKNWLSRLLLFFLLISFSPFLSSGFLAFTEDNQRWWFMMILLMALASAKVLDRAEDYPVSHGAIAYALSLIVFVLVLFFVPYNAKHDELVFDAPRLLILGGIALLGTLLLWILYKKNKLTSPIMLALVCIFAIGSTAYTLAVYRSRPKAEASQFQILQGTKLDPIDDQYRYNLQYNMNMLTGGGSGMTVFSSTLSRGVIEFDAMFDYSDNHHSMDKTTIPGLAELFAAKYEVTSKPGKATPVREFEVLGEKSYVIERPACPIGFAVDQVILRSDLLDIENEKKGIALLQAAVIEEADLKKVAGLCKRVTAADLQLDLDVSTAVEANTAQAVSDFHRDISGFRCSTNYATDKLVYFSVPNEGGWQAEIDGQKQDLISSAGMMLLPVPAGSHQIVCRYVTPGYPLGCWISLAAWVLYIIYVCVGLRRKKKGEVKA